MIEALTAIYYGFITLGAIGGVLYFYNTLQLIILMRKKRSAESQFLERVSERLQVEHEIDNSKNVVRFPD